VKPKNNEGDSEKSIGVAALVPGTGGDRVIPVEQPQSITDGACEAVVAVRGAANSPASALNQ
jgi:hypothetical protein